MSLDPDQEARLQRIQELIFRIAGGEHDAREKISPAHDEIDAVLVAVNVLAEELQVAHTARERAEALLRDEHEAYDEAPGMFCSVSADDLRVVKCNQTLADALGRDKEDLIGRSVLDIHHADSRPRVEKALAALVRGEDPVEHELEFDLDDDTRLPVSLRGSAVHDERGEPARLRLIWRDLSEEKRLETHLLQAQKMESVGMLAGGIAHDFNNILTAIQNFAYFIAQALPDDSPIADDARQIKIATGRAAELTGHLLAFSRHQVVDPQPVDLNRLVAAGARMLEHVLAEHIDLRTVLDPKPAIALLDETRFEQVILNLVVNARDAMPDGGTLTIRTGHERVRSGSELERYGLSPGDFVVVSVEDSGAGMTAEVQARAFDPFFTTKPRGKGTGLGLSTCYGIVAQAGGQMRLDSDPGRGTTIAIYLPRAEQEPQPRPVPTKATPSAPTGSETILIVEDDRPLRASAARALEKAGYTVLEAEDGEQGLAIAGRPDVSIDLVISDVVMPLMSGIEFISRLRAEVGDHPVLFITGYTDNQSLLSGRLQPDTALLQKPFTPDTLLRSVRSCLQADATRHSN